MTDDLHDFLRSRRSIRRFRQEPVPVKLVNRIIETATYAPSAHDSQPWRFIVITGNSSKEHLGKAITDKFRTDARVDGTSGENVNERVQRTLQRIDEAPVIILLCLDTTQVNHQPDEARQRAEELMSIQSVALAGLQLLLAAHAEGLGGVWICWPLFAPGETQKALSLPSEWQPQGMLLLGYPAEGPAAPGKKPLEEIVRYL